MSLLRMLDRGGGGVGSPPNYLPDPNKKSDPDLKPDTTIGLYKKYYGKSHNIWLTKNCYWLKVFKY